MKIERKGEGVRDEEGEEEIGRKKRHRKREEV